MKFIFSLLCTLTYLSLSAQYSSSATSTYTIQLLSNPDNSPIENASVVLNDSSYTTNSRGFVQVLATIGDTIVVNHQSHKVAIIDIPEVTSFKAKIDLKDVLLKYEGGINTFYYLLNRTIQYPSSAQRSGHRGTIMVYFTIDENGEMILDPESENKKTKILEKEVLSVLSKLNGGWSKEYANVQFTLPVTFNLSSYKNNPIHDFEIKGYLLKNLTITGYSTSIKRTTTIRN